MMRKAVSPIVATVLLIIIAVAAGVLIWVWLHGFAEKNPTAQPTLQEEFKIDTISYDPTTQTAVIYVRNIGQVIDNISAAYILDVNGNTVCSNTTSYISDVQVQPGSVAEVLIKNCPLNSGSAYVAKIVTLRGVEATYQFIAP